MMVNNDHGRHVLRVQLVRFYHRVVRNINTEANFVVRFARRVAEPSANKQTVQAERALKGVVSAYSR